MKEKEKNRNQTCSIKLVFLLPNFITKLAFVKSLKAKKGGIINKIHTHI